MSKKAPFEEPTYKREWQTEKTITAVPHTKCALFRDTPAATQVQRRETQKEKEVVGLGSSKHTSTTSNT